ncbi:MAG: undecaprenyl/decaprenyl-phosphate alpha-N-acetylglucosaminyl 1-phosphate transferase [Gemmatimonadaceae bacterium]|nr:undecaprenyl/decaprenyl-phosphate alpha-N-acetylglucosaminyl 1-phosphate transferase [Gemmatimonadaceae bacterium]
MVLSVFLAVGAAYIICVALIPLIRHAAVRHRLLDLSGEHRRHHERPIPRLGGVAVFLSLLVVAAAGTLLDDKAHVLLLLPFVASISIGATILFVTGLVDDLVGVRPLGKLIAQSVAGLIVWYAGFRIEVVMLAPSYQLSLGLLGLPITVLWVVGLSNAFNLVDGADGLAGGVAVVALLSTAVSAVIVHDSTVFWCSLALLGAMLGFLRFNVPPARIFLGDSGSLVVGFLLAVLTVKGASTRTGPVYVIAPIFALSYPLLDTGISMMRRWLRGEPLSRADGRHIHHQLRALGMGPRQSVLLICGLSAVIAALGLSATFASPDFTIAIAVAGAAMLVLIFVYGLRWLQYHEFLEAGASLTSAAMRGRTVIRDKIHARDVATLLRGATTFEQLSTTLEESAASFRFVHVELQGRSDTRQLAEPVAVQVCGAATWKLEYPIERPGSTLVQPIFLSIWCTTAGWGTTAGAERVAQILAPAVADWFAAHWEQAEVQRILTDRFPGIVTPTRGFPTISGDFALQKQSRTRGSDARRQLNGD